MYRATKELGIGLKHPHKGITSEASNLFPSANSIAARYQTGSKILFLQL